jgi:hypothetical protein
MRSRRRKPRRRKREAALDSATSDEERAAVQAELDAAGAALMRQRRIWTPLKPPQPARRRPSRPQSLRPQTGTRSQRRWSRRSGSCWGSERPRFAHPAPRPLSAPLPLRVSELRGCKAAPDLRMSARGERGGLFGRPRC